MKELLQGNIQMVESFEEFQQVFEGYSSFPYFEEWGLEEIRTEYENHLKDGQVFGCYYEGKCVGIITLIEATKYEHPVHFSEPEKALYISNAIVIPAYRNHGFGTQLAEYAVQFAKDNDYKDIYFRCREEREYGEKIARRLGFYWLYDSCEEVRRPRKSNCYLEHGDHDVRIFMRKKL